MIIEYRYIDRQRSILVERKRKSDDILREGKVMRCYERPTEGIRVGCGGGGMGEYRGEW